ncbi:hypothetical protein K438DRAFT_1979237 [Mycena galopus ATCC 62051]|nr:hypothetical protein K438DRAFT_1979237 [Mycena galopus ATCC 62051]
MAPSIKVGDTLPKGEFGYIPWAKELESHASFLHWIPIFSTNPGPIARMWSSQIDTERDWKGKKVVLFSVPGAFTAKGVDVVAVVAANDLFVMSGWARFEGCKDKILALSDAGAKWSGALNLSVDLTEKGLGVRTARYAMIIEDLVVKYVEVWMRSSVCGTFWLNGDGY